VDRFTGTSFDCRSNKIFAYAILGSRDERKRAPDAFAPQGAGTLTGHKCAGYDFATVMMQLFAVLALRTASWDLPEQDLSLKWVVPPEHKSGLVVRWSKAT